jgi:hypothetical protein
MVEFSNEYPGGRVREERSGVAVVEYRDRVRWGPIIAGLAIALALQLILSALGTAVGATTIATSGAPRTQAGDVGTAVGIWSIISLLISLFLGGYVTSRASGPLNRGTALLNGAILWAASLILGAFLIASGVTGAFGVVASNAGAVINQAQLGGANIPAQAPNVSAEQARQIADSIAKASGSFALGSLFGLAAALIGASVGIHRHRTATPEAVAERRV